MRKLTENSQWYALYVRSRAEKYVALQLENKCQQVFLPLYRSRRKWADRWKTVSLPLFPGYVFCRFDLAERPSVSATSGLIDIVKAGNELAPVNATEIEAIRRIVDSPLEVKPYPGLAKGQQIRIFAGPLKGIDGTLLEIRNSIRLVVSVKLLQRSVSAEIEREWVVPCDPLPAVLVAQSLALEGAK